MPVEDLTGRAWAWWRRYGPLSLGVLAWLAVVVVAVSRARGAAATPAAGLDLKPVRNAGLALRMGHSMYVPGFVYPPPASLIGWVESFFSMHTDMVAYTYFEGNCSGPLTV